MPQILPCCKREHCVWRIHTGGKPVCTKARCPYRERVLYILREQQKDETKEGDNYVQTTDQP